MLLLRKDRLPESSNYLYEIKLDGYRALAGREGDRVLLRSRNDNDFCSKFPAIARALHSLPNAILVDGELAMLDSQGRPSFNLIQNHRSSTGTLIYYIFDLLVFQGESLIARPLVERKAILEKKLAPKLREPLRYMRPIEGALKDLIKAVKENGLEGIVAKRRDSVYEPAARSGAWQKMRVNSGQEFVIGGYTVGGSTFDALVFGYYERGNLLYASRTRNGFTPLLRAEMLEKMKPLATKKCPFANLPEARAGRWGAGLTAAKMKDCIWLKPTLVGQFEFVEWTDDGHLRHSKFVDLRDDKPAQSVVRE